MKFWKRFGGYMPILATIVVVGCVGTALKGYAAPVYEVEQPETIQSTEADAKEKKQETEETEQAKKGNFDLADGFYKGSGTGFAGTVSVSVEIKDKSIVAINILSTQDDEAFFNRAKGVIDKIIAGQTLDVDVVSGATYSSNGIISAVKNALTGEQDTSTPATTASSSNQSSPSSKLWMIPIRHGKTAPIMAVVPDLMVKCRYRLLLRMEKSLILMSLAIMMTAVL